MAAFATVFGSFSLLCLLYSRLTNGSYGLFPVGWNLSAERLAWWAVLWLAGWTVGVGLWRLSWSRGHTARSIAVGSVLSVLCIGGVLWYAHHVDPGNESKVVRVAYPPWLTAATLVVAVALWLVNRGRGKKTETPTDLPASSVLRYRSPSTLDQPKRRHMTAIVLAATSFVVGVAVWIVKRQFARYSTFEAEFQILELVCAFVLPVALLHWASLSAQAGRDRRFGLVAKVAAVGLMGVAALGM